MMRPRSSGIVVDMRPQLGDRAEPHCPLRKLRLDRSVGVERIGHAVDHPGFEDGGLARLLRGGGLVRPRTLACRLRRLSGSCLGSPWLVLALLALGPD